VLVDEQGTARLCDFGLSRIIDESTLWNTSAISAPGTTRWKAPEILNGQQVTVTVHSDMYAFGMTFFVSSDKYTVNWISRLIFYQEVFTGQIPFQHYQIEAMVIKAVALSGEIPDKSIFSKCCDSEEVWQHLLKCWDRDPAARPSAVEALDYLSKRKALISLGSSIIVKILSKLDTNSILSCGEVGTNIFDVLGY
jgi:serine/threonine protein kinase